MIALFLISVGSLEPVNTSFIYLPHTMGSAQRMEYKSAASINFIVYKQRSFHTPNVNITTDNH